MASRRIEADRFFTSDFTPKVIFFFFFFASIFLTRVSNSVVIGVESSLVFVITVFLSRSFGRDMRVSGLFGGRLQKGDRSRRS